MPKPDKTSTTDQPQTAVVPLADGDTWMTTAEVAQQWGRNIETVRRWIRDGQLPANRLPGGRTLLIRRSDALATIERGRIEATPAGREHHGEPLEVRVPGDRTELIED